MGNINYYVAAENFFKPFLIDYPLWGIG